MAIFWPLIVLSSFGLLFGVGLAYASKKLAVEINPVIGVIREILPGANCGACGYAGCDAYAAAVANGSAAHNLCPVGGLEVAKNISATMGETEYIAQKMVAMVCCQGNIAHAAQKYVYEGIQDCAAAVLLANGPKACAYGCVGMGTCVHACPFGAIFLDEYGVAQVDPDLCKSCGKCVAVCPKRIIKMIPYEHEVTVKCRALDRGRSVSENCDIGCIGCGLCARRCKFNAITIENNLPVIEYNKCKQCMACAEVCPTHTIFADLARRKIPKISGECIGCMRCARECPFGAISGTVTEKHIVDFDKCKGCSVCAEVCPKNAILMVRPDVN